MDPNLLLEQDAAEKMAAFDKLPPELRAYCREHDYNPVEALECLRRGYPPQLIINLWDRDRFARSQQYLAWLSTFC